MDTDTENKNPKNTSFYLGAIILIIFILSFRILTQGRQMSDSIDRIQEEGLEMAIPDEDEINEIDLFNSSEEASVTLDEKFTTPDGRLSLKYSSDWQEVEDDNILAIFQRPHGDYRLPGEFEDTTDLEELKDLEDELGYRDEDFPQYEYEQQQKEVFPETETLFIATKSTFPDLSLGVFSVQKVELEEEKTLENLKESMISSLEYEDEDTKIEIVSTEKEDYFAWVETVTLVRGRPVFKSTNLGLLGESTYIINFNADYEGWDKMESEFNEITSTVEFDDS